MSSRRQADPPRCSEAPRRSRIDADIPSLGAEKGEFLLTKSGACGCRADFSAAIDIHLESGTVGGSDFSSYPASSAFLCALAHSDADEKLAYLQDIACVLISVVSSATTGRARCDSLSYLLQGKMGKSTY